MYCMFSSRGSIGSAAGSRVPRSAQPLPKAGNQRSRGAVWQLCPVLLSAAQRVARLPEGLGHQALEGVCLRSLLAEPLRLWRERACPNWGRAAHSKDGQKRVLGAVCDSQRHLNPLVPGWCLR